jgi:hypothetical protein
MRASAGSRTASARSARRPPRAPDARGDMGLGDPQPSIGDARRLRAAVVRQNSGSSAGHARRRNKTHRAPSVWVRTTPPRDKRCETWPVPIGVSIGGDKRRTQTESNWRHGFSLFLCARAADAE